MHYQPHTVSNMHPRGDFSGTASTSYDSYPPVSAYSSTTSAYFGAQTVPCETQKGIMGRPTGRQSPSGSPSPSISQAFDNPPSTLSSASGASAQSTASSTDGSPYASTTHALPYEDKWSGPFHGLGIAPGIVSSDSFGQDSFPPANFENDLMLEESKFPNFVGEYGNSFSPSVSLSQLSASSVFSGLALQNFEPNFLSRPLALERITVTKDTTIDSILEEANTKIQNTAQVVSPISAASAAASPPSFITTLQPASHTQRESSFRTPLTPLSAVSPISARATSPQRYGDHVKFGHPVVPLNDLRAPRSPQESLERCRPCNKSTSSPVPQHQALYAQSQISYFGQSSGRFVPPLESSCLFTLSPFPCFSLRHLVQLHLFCFRSAFVVANQS